MMSHLKPSDKGGHTPKRHLTDLSHNSVSDIFLRCVSVCVVVFTACWHCARAHANRQPINPVNHVISWPDTSPYAQGYRSANRAALWHAAIVSHALAPQLLVAAAAAALWGRHDAGAAGIARRAAAEARRRSQEE
jgi:hypothetical protein